MTPTREEMPKMCVEETTAPTDNKAELLAWLEANAPDCGDNSCMFGGRRKGGMRTNGGCRCLKSAPPQATRIYFERLEELKRHLTEPSEIEQAALNLCKVKGRYHSEQAMNRLLRACGFPADDKDAGRFPNVGTPGHIDHSKLSEGEKALIDAKRACESQRKHFKCGCGVPCDCFSVSSGITACVQAIEALAAYEKEEGK